MRHRIRAAGIAIKDDAILLIKHVYKNQTFWVPPGGGFEPGDGSTEGTVIRELREESGLTAKVGPLIYVREFEETSEQVYHLELFFVLDQIEGELTLENLEGLGGDEHHITAARWVPRDELASITVYPKEIQDDLWQRLEERPLVKHLGLQREIEGASR